MSDIAEPVRSQLLAYNNRDIENFAKCFSKDVLVTREGAEKPLLVGIEEFKKFYRDLFETSPNLHAKLIDRRIEGTYVYDTEEVSGRAGSTGIIKAEARYKILAGQISEVHFRIF